MNSPTPRYFCDLLMADINAISCSAARFLYHGSTHGPFGKGGQQLQSVDMKDIDAFRVSLEHLSTDPLSDAYDYHLVYVAKSAYKQIWHGCKKHKIPGMKHISDEIRLSDTAKLTSHIPLFWSKKESSITLSEYRDDIAMDHYIPDAYRYAFQQKFSGILMRTKNDCRLLWLLLEAHGLKVVDHREVCDEYDGKLKVDCFASYSNRTFRKTASPISCLAPTGRLA